MESASSLRNTTLIQEFSLLGFPDFPIFQLVLSPFISITYLMILVVNLLILVLIHSDHHLHTPMYFFLGHLACLDIFSSTVTVPRMISDVFSEKKTISHSSCVAQIFFFLMFAGAEIFLLAVMSYDRYIAICRPLHYILVMSREVCVLMASLAWTLGIVNSFINSIFTHRLYFCKKNTIKSFFCELPLLLQISCSDIFINILIMFLSASFATFALGVTFIPYVQIFRSILRISTKEGKQKAFSTCTSHLTVVFVFYGTLFFTHLRPIPSQQTITDRLISIIYSTITPFLNPLIYSMRNNELKDAVRKIMSKSHKLFGWKCKKKS